MTEVFLSYRRSDSEDAVGRIYEHLSQRFGSGAIFKDVQSIGVGADFTQAIHNALSASQVVLVIIGRRWLSETSADGHRRIDLPDDLVRREVETALGEGKLVVPVLASGAEMPDAATLPSSIRELASRQAVRVRPDPDFSADITRLIRVIEANTKALNDSNARPPAMARPHQEAALPLHFLIVAVFGVLALTSIAGGIYAVAVNAASATTLNFFGANLTTGHVGVAMVGLGLLIAFFTVRAVLENQKELAALPSDDAPGRDLRKRPLWPLSTTAVLAVAVAGIGLFGL